MANPSHFFRESQDAIPCGKISPHSEATQFAGLMALRCATTDG
jgi:hypothetical protein